MSDERLRELERRWRETGSVEDEAASLRARVQAGELERENVDFAARLGHKAARAAVQSSEPAQPLAAARALRPYGLGGAARALVALARGADSVAGHGYGVFALEAAEDWIVCPCDYHSKAARVAGEFPVSGLGGFGPLVSTPSARLAASIMSGSDYLSDMQLEENRSSGEYAAIVTFAVTEMLETPERFTDPSIVLSPLEWLCAELAPWVLGYLDPVRDRVMARDGGRRPENWPFEDPANALALTRHSIVAHATDVLLVKREAGEGWCFLDSCGDGVEVEVAASLGKLLEIDPTLRDVANLSEGWRAFRVEKGLPWQRAEAAGE